MMRPSRLATPRNHSPCAITLRSGSPNAAGLSGGSRALCGFRPLQAGGSASGLTTSRCLHTYLRSPQ
jgi:hypothetical protein